MGGSASESTPGVGCWSRSAGLLALSGVPATLMPPETPVVSPGSRGGGWTPQGSPLQKALFLRVIWHIPQLCFIKEFLL